MTFDARNTSSLTYTSRKFVTTANGTSTPVMGKGTSNLTEKMNLNSVLVVPSLDYNLLSVSQITTNLNCVVIFWPDYCVFKDITTKKTIGYGVRRGKLYYLELEPKTSKRVERALVAKGHQGNKKELDIWLYHRRFGHTSFGYLKRLFPTLFEKCDVSKFHCEVCELAKSHRASFPLTLSKNTLPFMTIHSDVWGPSKVPTMSGARWFVTFIDDYSRMTWLCPMKSKDEVNVLFQKFHKMVETQYGVKIRVLHSDNGGEYKNTGLKRYLEEYGVVHHTTSHMPISYWGEAAATATYLINRVPSSSIDFQTPLQALTTTVVAPIVPELPLRVFGCIAFVHLYKHQRSKLNPRALRCVFVGYDNNKKGYRCYHPSTKHMYVTMDVVFHEEKMFFRESESQGENYHEIQTLDYMHSKLDVTRNESQGEYSLENEKNNNEAPRSGEEVSTDEIPPENENEGENFEFYIEDDDELDTTIPDQSLSQEDVVEELPDQSLSQEDDQIVEEQILQPPPEKKAASSSLQQRYPMSNYVSVQNLSDTNKVFVNQLSVVAIPNSVQEALADPKWKNAMNEEMSSLQKNATWDLTDLPPGKRTVGCRWIYTVKYKADGSIERYKARLVAKGYTQTHGIDYTETFAPVAKINTVRVLLSLAANLDWPLRQFDVKNAFLHGDLSEEVYMDPPPGCVMTENQKNKVCKLKKSLYGLKQSPRAWFGRFTKAMKSFGFNQSNADHTLFLKRKHNKITALIVYVDDMVVTGDDPDEQTALQNYLSREFEMKDLGPLKYFLGIEVSRSKAGILLSQRKYTLDLLQETGMSGCRPADTPMLEGLKLKNEENQVPVDKKRRYQRLVGRLMYLAHTRPDIAHTLSVISQFMHNPGEQHMNAVMHLLRYLKSAPGKGVLFKKGSNCESVEVYTDADWAGSKVDGRSTSGYFSFVGGNLVTWRSKKQHVVSRSSAEAEFRSMALGICEALWLKRLLQDLGRPIQKPIQLFCDNKSARDIAHNPVHHDRTKHVEVDRFFIKEKLENKTLEVRKIQSEDQPADILTKAVSKKVFSKLLSKLGILVVEASYTSRASITNRTSMRVDVQADLMSFDYEKYHSSVWEDDEIPGVVQFTTKTLSYLYKGRLLDLMSGLDLSHNRLTGEIPEELGSLTQIHALNLSHNQLYGPIPVNFSNLANIESLDLSSNHLSGEFPSEPIKLNSLAVFNVSHNGLSSRLIEMRAQFATFSKDSYEGNPPPCGPPLEKNCIATSQVNDPSTNEGFDKWYHVDVVSFYGSSGATWVVFLLGFVGVLYINPYWRRRWLEFVEECMYTFYYFLEDSVKKLSTLFRK
ncbi:hypothetical protein OSB04_un001074 [Centaurea solstitialis]|uniref:Integrase catalytic domain-containing protein n=1 Tax=Centaurea solstitialis TaxID=347529 RepID=A0AA38W2Y8_9ASTR|nr:hypothetical protein OSB04_un001074 [Centaurea solstitialis]